MARYMVIVLDEDGETIANFFTSYEKAENYRMNAVVSMGLYAELYERTDTEWGREYTLIYA